MSDFEAVGDGLAKAAVRFIAAQEGLRLVPYQDIAGHWTVGFGERCDSVQQPITRQQAEEMLARRVQGIISKNDDVLCGLPEEAAVGVVSLIFNIGGGAWERSTVRSNLLGGLVREAALEIMRWCHYRNGDGELCVSEGLVRRRKAEALRLLEGVCQCG